METALQQRAQRLHSSALRGAAPSPPTALPSHGAARLPFSIGLWKGSVQTILLAAPWLGRGSAAPGLLPLALLGTGLELELLLLRANLSSASSFPL